MADLPRRVVLWLGLGEGPTGAQCVGPSLTHRYATTVHLARRNSPLGRAVLFHLGIATAIESSELARRSLRPTDIPVV